MHLNEMQVFTFLVDHERKVKAHPPTSERAFKHDSSRLVDKRQQKCKRLLSWWIMSVGVMMCGSGSVPASTPLASDTTTAGDLDRSFHTFPISRKHPASPWRVAR